MADIRKLDPALIEQLADAVLIERPASVVHELIENAIDAGAIFVDVAITEGGRDQIVVRDDGEGMAREHVMRALQPYTSSRVHTLEDLRSSAALGFRGQALHDIAASARVTIETRPRDASVGTRLIVAAGSAAAEDVACEAGTRVEVRELFAGAPERRAQLCTAATETGHVHAAAIELALAHPGLRLRLESNGKRLFHVLPAQGQDGLRQRLIALLGRDVADALRPLSARRGELRLQGMIAAPALARGNARGYHLCVNGWPVSHRGLARAVRDGYGAALEPGRHPVVILQLRLPPAMVDRCAAATKRGVQLLDEEGIEGFVRDAVSAAVAEGPWELAPASSRRPRPVRGVDQLAQPPEPLLGAPRPAPGGDDEEVEDLYFTNLEPLGQLAGRYLVAASETALVLIDLRAARSRVVFERLREGRSSGLADALRLPEPQRVQVGGELLELAWNRVDTVAAMGFEIVPGDESSLEVRYVPEVLAELPMDPMVRALLDAIARHVPSDRAEEGHDEVFARLADLAAEHMPLPLDETALATLLGELDGVDLNADAPVGQVVAREIPVAELEALFRLSPLTQRPEH